MHRWLIRDWGAKLGAVLLAAALWFHAATEDSYRRDLDVPLIVEEGWGKLRRSIDAPHREDAVLPVFFV